MEKGGGKILFFVFLFTLGAVLNLVFVDQVFCYDTNIAHPGIAGLAVKVYNKNNSKKITVEQYEWIKQGAVEEDNPTRWLNHFYDPIYNRGLWFITQHESSKVWAKDPVEQKSYSKGDNSWQRAISDYRSGDQESAFKKLGHNIHLVSDALVPAHTRDDIHAPKPDSYEEYVKNNWNAISKDINVQPIYKDKLENIFDGAANYSNNNFYSDDTIEDKNYKINSVDKVLEIKTKYDKMFLIQSKIDQEFFSLYATDGSDWKKSNHKILNEDLVLSDYAHHLLPKAVAYSAGTIKLFLDETQKNQTEKLPFFRSNLGGLVNSLGGAVINVAENIYKGNASQADTSSGVLTQTVTQSLNKTTDAIVSKIENIGKSINKKIPISQNVASQTPSTLKNSDQSNPVSFVPELPNDRPITTNEIITTPRATSNFPATSGGGGGSASPVVNTNLSNSENTSSAFPTVTIPVSTTSTEDSNVSAPTTTSESSSSDTSTTSTNSDVPDTTTSTTTSTSTTPDPSDLIISPTSTTSTEPEIDTTSTIFSTSTIPDQIENLDSFTTSTTSTVVTSTTEVVTTTVSNTTTVVTSTVETAPVVVPDVVINEVAWAGTSQFTSEDEYIELYNNTNQDIELFSTTNIQKRWKLKIAGQEININKINNSTIPAHGYYLLENPDNRTVNEIDGDLIYSGSLSNSGTRLELFDSQNNLVDELNSSAGWFAGSATTYSSMEKINSTLSGNLSNNWQTNQGPRLAGKVDGGGDALPLNGSPKQSNFGSIVLRATQVDVERTLKKSDYPYILTYYEVPAGKILSIEEGAVVKAYYPNSKIEIKGTLNTSGSPSQKVIMTSDNKLSKSWQGLMFYPGSKGDLKGLEMSYAGAKFRAPNLNSSQLPVSEAIYADSASLNISGSDFVDDGDTIIYEINSKSSINSTNFKNGITAIEHYGGQLSLENITVDNFSNPTGAIYVKNIWPRLLDVISFSNSANGAVNIAMATITSSVVVGTSIPINLENVTIEAGGSLAADKGASFYLPQFSNIFIKGTLTLNGTVDEPIKFVGPTGLNKYWGHLVFDGGVGNLNSVNFSGGGYNSPGDSYKGVISVNNNSQVTLENCQLIDNRLPVEIIQINSSTVNLNNTSLGYTSKNTFFPTIKGVQVNTGALSVDNSFFYNLTEGIMAGSANPFPQLNLTNMDTRNFINVNTYWSPPGWFSQSF